MNHIYMGEGKGKTTAAAGLAIRCAGQDGRVLFTQFLKDGTSGEINALYQVDGIQLYICPAYFGFSWTLSEEEKQAAAIVYERYLMDIMRMVCQGSFSMLVLDEVIGACSAGYIDPDMLLEELQALPEDIEIVLTGRYPSEKLIEWADYVTEMNKIKHPYDRGTAARKGIEY